MNRLPALIVPALILALGTSCDRAPAAYGEANSVIIAAPDSLWAGVQDTVRTALEPTIFTVRDERAFQVTHTSPLVADWGELRKFKRVLVIGRASDPWMEPVLDDRDGPVGTRAELVEASGIWAGGQSVTAIVLPDGADPEDAVASILPELHRRLDTSFRAYAQTRMFLSGRDEALADTLRRDAGFGLLVPNVYAWSALDSTTYRFLNTFPDPEKLIRSITVTWRPGADDTPRAADVLDWRDSIADARYEYFTQVTRRDRIETAEPTVAGGRALDVQGIWTTPEGEWPAAGPFISRAVVCPSQNRTYLVDAWLYAPDRDKYEYMIQLQTILDSFECG